MGRDLRDGVGDWEGGEGRGNQGKGEGGRRLGMLWKGRRRSRMWVVEGAWGRRV